MEKLFWLGAVASLARRIAEMEARHAQLRQRAEASLNWAFAPPPRERRTYRSPPNEPGRSSSSVVASTPMPDWYSSGPAYASSTEPAMASGFSGGGGSFDGGGASGDWSASDSCSSSSSSDPGSSSCSSSD